MVRFISGGRAITEWSSIRGYDTRRQCIFFAELERARRLHSDYLRGDRPVHPFGRRGRYILCGDSPLGEPTTSSPDSLSGLLTAWQAHDEDPIPLQFPQHRRSISLRPQPEICDGTSRYIPGLVPDYDMWEPRTVELRNLTWRLGLFPKRMCLAPTICGGRMDRDLSDLTLLPRESPRRPMSRIWPSSGPGTDAIMCTVCIGSTPPCNV